MTLSHFNDVCDRTSLIHALLDAIESLSGTYEAYKCGWYVRTLRHVLDLDPVADVSGVIERCKVRAFTDF